MAACGVLNEKWQTSYGASAYQRELIAAHHGGGVLEKASAFEGRRRKAFSAAYYKSGSTSAEV